jgi:hypothetical protein
MIAFSSRRAVLGPLLGLALAGLSLTPALAQATNGSHRPGAHQAKKKKKSKSKKKGGQQVIVHCASVGVTCKGTPGPTGPTGPTGLQGTPGANGANVVLRARGMASTEVSAESSSCGTIICGSSIPLSASSWIEGPEEDDQLVGSVTITLPGETACGAEEGGTLEDDKAILAAEVDGKLEGITEVGGSTAETTVSSEIVFDLGIEALEAAEEGFGTGFFMGSGTSQTHVLTVEAEDECKTAVHATVSNLAIDVLGTS